MKQKQKQTTATKKHRMAMMSSYPARIAAKDTSSEDSINASPPPARQKAARASVGGREGKMDVGGRSQRKT